MNLAPSALSLFLFGTVTIMISKRTIVTAAKSTAFLLPSSSFATNTCKKYNHNNNQHTLAATSSHSPSINSLPIIGRRRKLYRHNVSPFSSLSSSQQHQQYHKNKIQQRGGIEELHQSQDALIVSLFAHADELAFGSENNNNNRHNGNCDNDPSIVITGGGNASSGSDCGNRPSTILLCSKLDAFTCGQLVAMAEHRAVVKAWIWEIDPFQRIETKTVLRSKRTESLKESLRKMIYNGDDDDNDIEENEIGELNLSTRTILRHYANMVRGQRTNTK